MNDNLRGTMQSVDVESSPHHWVAKYVFPFPEPTVLFRHTNEMKVPSAERVSVPRYESDEYVVQLDGVIV